MGLLLACELQRLGVAHLLVEKAPERAYFCKAMGVTPCTLEIFEAIGVVDHAIDAGVWLNGMTAFDNGVETPSQVPPFEGLPYGFLALPQYETERILEAGLYRHGGSSTTRHDTGRFYGCPRRRRSAADGHRGNGSSRSVSLAGGMRRRAQRGPQSPWFRLFGRKFINYRSSAWVQDDMAQGADEPGAPRAGDRAPDATDLSRPRVAHRLWLRERLERGHHVLVGYTAGNSTASDQRAFADLVERAQKRLGGLAVGLAMIASGARFVEGEQIPVLSDPDDTFQRAYRARPGMV